MAAFFKALAEVGRVAYYRSMGRYVTLSTVLTESEALEHKVQGWASDSAAALQEALTTLKSESDVDRSKVHQQLLEIFETSVTLHDAKQKLRSIRDSFGVDAICLLSMDAAFLMLNIVSLMKTYSLMLEASRIHEEVVRYLENKNQDFNYLLDIVQNWTSISENDRLKAKLKVSSEIIDLLKQIRVIEATQHKLEVDKIYKYFWSIGSLLVLATGAVAYRSIWRFVTPSVHMAATLTTTGLSAAVVSQLVQAHQISAQLEELAETQKLLVTNQEDLTEILAH